jgi:hypothetical protein
MGVAEDPGRVVAPEGLGDGRVGVAVLAQREQPLLAIPAAAAGDHRADDHPVADLVAADLGADLDDLAHELMADHVAGAHEGDVAADLVQVGPTDRAEVDLEDRVLVVEQLRVGDLVDRELVHAFPG